jgi:rSAM/selenodomain-associated transferase 1
MWPADRYAYRLQKRGDLGRRMSEAFKEVLTTYKSAVIIGTDCPYLNADLLRTAFKIIKKNDAVIGPSTDGGYYLLGLRKHIPALFTNMAWSTSAVLPITIGRFFELELSNAMLPTLTDIDEAEDWAAYQQTKAV